MTTPEQEFSLWCPNGHNTYVRLRVPGFQTLKPADCHCGAPREVIDQCAVGERPLLRQTLGKPDEPLPEAWR